MASITAEELRDHTETVLARVAAGEALVVTVDGQPVATLTPTPRRPRWITREAFVELLASASADPARRDDIDALTGGETVGGPA